MDKDFYINNFISGKDIYINFDKFKTDKINKCFILGLSGSGKSTLSENLAKKYNALVVHMDLFRGQVYYTDDYLRINHPIIYEYFTKHFKMNRMNIKTMPKEMRHKEFDKFIYWLLSLKERLIIEGDLNRILEEDDGLKTYPIVFKGTSMTTSMIRMLKRELIRNNKRGIDDIIWALKWAARYYDHKTEQNKIREQIIIKMNQNDYKEEDE